MNGQNTADQWVANQTSDIDQMEMLAQLFKPSFLEMFGGPIGGMAGTLFSGLADLIGGKSEGEQAREKTRGLISNRMGQPVVDPQQFYAGIMNQLLPQMKRRGEVMEKKIGLDVGVGQGELFSDFFENATNQLFELQRWAAQLNAQADMQRLQMLTQLSMVQ